MIVFNEPALALLLNSSEGPVGRHIALKAEAVTLRARGRVQNIMAGTPVPIENAVDFSLRPDASAEVGIREDGRMTEYLARKEQREHVWLFPSLREVFPLNAA